MYYIMSILLTIFSFRLVAEACEFGVFQFSNLSHWHKFFLSLVGILFLGLAVFFAILPGRDENSSMKKATWE